MTAKEFGAKVKEERIKRGLYQRKVAFDLGLNFQDLSAIERGVRVVSLEKKKKIMSYFSIDYNEKKYIICKKVKIK